MTQFENAKAAYHRVLDRDPSHAKVLQQLGWLYHTQSQHFDSQERAIEYLEKSVAAGGSPRPNRRVGSLKASGRF
jgi:tetratricopeptide (TPR) repeat protein